MSVKNKELRIAQLLANFLLKQGYFRRYDDTIDAVYLLIKHGATEIFKYLHDTIPEIEKLENYRNLLNEGFTLACEKGHGEFIKYILQNGHVTSVRDVAGRVIIWKNNNHWDDYDVEDPVLTAAKYSRISVLEALVEHDPTLLAYEGLLETAALGLRPHGYHRFFHRYYRDYSNYERKPGSSYAVTQWLIDRGLPIDKNTINFTNFMAKYLLARRTISGDFAMTLIILLVTLKSRFHPVRLRKQIHVPVKKVLQKITDVQPEMRPVGPLRHDFAALARELSAWLATHR